MVQNLHSAKTIGSAKSTRSVKSVQSASSSTRSLRVALVCDWLTNVGGAERVLKALTELFPSAPIYTSQYNPNKISWFDSSEVLLGWLQIFPSCLRRFLGPLRQLYFNHLYLSDYDLIISVTGAEAKSIKFNPARSVHLCYCHVPTQYYWGLYKSYLKNPGFGLLNPLVRCLLKIFLAPLRRADFAAAKRPSQFITISTYSAEQIQKFYHRSAEIIFPPVAIQNFSTDFSTSKSTKSRTPRSRSGFVVTSRQVTWKRLDLAIKACIDLDVPLTVIGEGPEHKNLVRLAKKYQKAHFAKIKGQSNQTNSAASKVRTPTPLVKFVPLQDQKALKTYLESAAGYIFPSLEPFGIAPVEALACGCPVIAYGRGGALDYVIDGENGVLFGKQSVNSLRQALKRFSRMTFDEAKVRASAQPFAEPLFKQRIRASVLQALRHHSVAKTKTSKEANGQ